MQTTHPKTGSICVRDSKLLIGSNKTYLFEKDIIHVVLKGPQDFFIALAQRKLHEQFCNILKSKVNYIINLDKAGKSSPAARRIWKEIIDRNDTHKAAFTGTHPVAKVLADFMMMSVNNPHVRYFTTEDEALGWLRSK